MLKVITLILSSVMLGGCSVTHVSIPENLPPSTIIRVESNLSVYKSASGADNNIEPHTDATARIPLLGEQEDTTYD